MQGSADDAPSIVSSSAEVEVKTESSMAVVELVADIDRLYFGKVG